MGSRLVLHEVHGRWPPITLKPRGRIVMGSSKKGELYDPNADTKAVAVTCVLDHRDIAAVQCEIHVSRNGTAELFNATPFALAQGSHEGYAKTGTTCLNGSAIQTTTRQAFGARNQLRVDDVITFSAHASAPSYVVRAVVSDPPPTSFPVLELPEDVLSSSVLPRLPLGTLAKFALASADCAQLVADSMADGQRWSAQSTGIVRTLEAVETRPELMRAVLGVVSAHVELSESTMWKLANYEHKLYSYSGDSQHYNGRAIEHGSEQNGAAYMLLQVIPDAERSQLSLLVGALAVRMTPTQFVSLLTTLRGQTALADKWPHSYTSPQSPLSAPPRLNLDLVGHFAVSSCARLGVWTPELLVSMGIALRWTGFQLGDIVQGLLWDDAKVDAISKLWMHGLDAAEQAEFLVGFHCFGDRLLEAIDGLVAIAVDEQVSVPFVLEILKHLDDRACEDTVGLGSDDYDTELRIEYQRAPSEFLSSWSAGRNFPLEFSLAAIALVAEFISDDDNICSEARPYFGALRLEWISKLLPPGGGMTELEVDKVRALSL